MRKNDYLIIMAGGIGSRFWPMSRNSYPKQFHDILGMGKSLLQMTWDRYTSFLPKENIFVVTNRAYRKLVASQLPDLNPENILGEPVGRNTAPCIAYGAFRIRQSSPDACIMVAPSDHLILDTDKFRKDSELALDAVRGNDLIMTIGIPPVRPDTGYGYIQFLEEGTQPYYKVKTFTEKPELEIAKQFLRSGDFLWNSGMFVFSAATFIGALQKHLPDMYDLFSAVEHDLGTAREETAIDLTYSKCRNISVDHGIMEKTSNVQVIPASFTWSDLGTWGSLYEQAEKDYLGNAVQGKVMIYKSANNIVRISDPDKLVVLDGLEDCIVVDTGDVLLICRMEDEQGIKEMVADVRNSTGDRYV